MKAACIGLALLIVAAGCQQKPQPTEKQSTSSPNGENSVAPEISSEASDEGNAGWVSDSWDSAMQTGSQTAEDTTEWLNSMYKSAVDTGSTSAKSMKDWVAADWHKQGDWEYKLLTIATQDASESEARLNELGGDRWECFHMTEQNGNWVFFMKRSRKSVLSHVPLKDLIKIVPLIGGGGDDGK